MRLSMAIVALSVSLNLASAQDVEGYLKSGTEAYNRGDYAEALRNFEVSAVHGHVVAQANLSIMYFHGVGVSKNDTLAIEWARKAAKQGYAVAQAQLGFLYLNARGSLQDKGEAAKWYRRSAEQGFDVAQTTLGTMLYQGIGVPQDFDEALKWFRRAAAQGNADAHAKIGVAYFRGDGVTQSDATAQRWFRLSAKLGNDTLSDVLTYLASKLTAAELADTERAVEEYIKRGFGENKASGETGISNGLLIGPELYPDRNR